MPKLVALTEGLTGRSYELKPEKTTVGRLDDNQFCIPEPSVSSHHCELMLKGDEIHVKDLGSTNGTFINGDQVSEGSLKPGQILRLGIVELRYETGKRQTDQPRQTVKLDPSGTQSFDKNAAFGRKDNKINKIFIGVGVVLLLAIVVFMVMAFSRMSGGAGQ
jgi:pSer/pThr/pTyr-binding forkhead associated (FHA) protein